MSRIHRLCVFILIACFCVTGCVSNNTLEAPWGTSRKATQEPGVLDIEPAAPAASPYVQQQPEPQAPADTYVNLPPVKVAILLPLSGQHANLGQAMLQSAQLALFDMGYENFELIPRDTQGTAQGGLQAASAAVNDGAQLILGPLFSDAAKAAQGVAARHNVNMVSFSTDWSLGGRNTFVMGFLPFAQVQRVTRFAAANGIRNIGLLAPADKYGDAVSKSFEQNAFQNAITITKNMRFNPNDRNITPSLQPFAAGPGGLPPEGMPETPYEPPYEAVFMPIGGTQAGVIASALSYYGLPPKNVRRLGTGLLDDVNLAREANLQGAWFAAPSPRARKPFEQRYQDTYGKRPPRLATLSYDATALAAVLAATGFQTTGRPAFDRNALMNPNGFAGIDGIFRFRSNGLIERGLAVLEYRNGRITEIDPAPNTFQTMGY